MNADAHYYAMLAFCRGCGFSRESASTIAYASQFVDDSAINEITLAGEIQVDGVCEKSGFYDMATCHSYFIMNTFNYTSMIKNTSAFHFIPGCTGFNFSRKMQCGHDSPVIKEILDEAIQQDDIVKFGMLLHILADSFSHEGFSGLLSEVNDIEGLKHDGRIYRDLVETIYNVIKRIARFFGASNFDSFFDKAMPSYGHCQALSYPDIPYLSWSYSFDPCDHCRGEIKKIRKVDNSRVYTDAFALTKEYLLRYLVLHPVHLDRTVADADFPEMFDILVKRTSDPSRIKIWRKFMIGKRFYSTGDDALYYDKWRWLRKAFKDFNKKKYNSRIVRNSVLSDGFEKSEWFGYYKSVRWYKNLFFDACKKHGLTISI